MLKEGHTDADVVDMVKEMEIMKSVGPHPNVVRFVGAPYPALYCHPGRQ